MRDIRHRVIIAFTITVLIALLSAVCVYFTIKYTLTIAITEKYTARFICAMIDLFVILILYIVICSLRNLYDVAQAIRGSDLYTAMISCITKGQEVLVAKYRNKFYIVR